MCHDCACIGRDELCSAKLLLPAPLLQTEPAAISALTAPTGMSWLLADDIFELSPRTTFAILNSACAQPHNLHADVCSLRRRSAFQLVILLLFLALVRRPSLELQRRYGHRPSLWTTPWQSETSTYAHA